MFEFKILKKDRRTGARVGFLKTPHGIVETPSYVIVGTHAEVRCLTPEDIPKTKTQLIIANTYHLWRTLGRKLDSFPGLHKFMDWDGPLMTDSGGFQVFSLGFAREHGVGKVASIFPGESASVIRRDKNLVTITEDGAYFEDSGEKLFLNPEISVGIQEKLGADIILAFDECTSPLHDYAYTKEAMERTHAWAERSLAAKKNRGQWIYGIVQGGEFEDLRKASAKFIGDLPFDGFAIGGSLGRSRSGMFDVIKWSVPFLPEAKPRHLLGIGKIEDLFEAVEMGMDTFDCVVPTREARHGSLWTKFGRFDVKQNVWRGSSMKIQSGCRCPVCGEMGLARGELFELFKTKHPDAARLATIHNVFFFNNLMAEIRSSIKDGKFDDFRMGFLNGLKH
jgi:queuine tRNA-ribosyltransferase/7-cyano-7-deazaguanine tRNA-ribosyltransferase